MSDLRLQLSKLWSQIVAIEAQINEFTDYPDPAPEMNVPATAANLKALESHLNVTLPPSYREFLTLSDGVRNFEGDMPLLSSDEIIAGEQGWVEELEEEDPKLARFFIAGSDETNAGYYVFNCDHASDEGELEIVHLTLNLWESRWPSFLNMLQDRLERSKALLEKERTDREMLKD